MVLNRGSKLGPYEILEPLGAGGMGEVYRARDTRLNRSVAIKISGAQFSERFEREARAVAALNHPHICALYDVGPDYLVMELVEGLTLAARIATGPVPTQEALDPLGGHMFTKWSSLQCGTHYPSRRTEWGIANRYVWE